jgi:signal transduction histidine kinase
MPAALELYQDLQPIEVAERAEPVNTNADATEYYQVLAAPLSVGSDRRIGESYVISDITEQRHREEQIRTHEAELEEKNERLDQFASLVSHDLRNPLTVAMAHTDRIEGTLDTVSGGSVSEIRDSVETLERSHQRMRDIIADGLDLARADNIVMVTKEVDLCEAAQEAWATVETGEAIFACDESATIEADRDKILTLLENLFRNAVEHGGAEVSVTVEPLSDPVGFAVADDGPGIPPQDRDDVLDHRHTTSDTGTGLGLSLVRKIADAHDWEISVDESATGGARFEVRAAATDSA